MPSPDSESPDEGFFNDLSQQAPEANNADGQDTQNDGSLKVKRIACVLCRKRKLRCDGARPECSTCKRLNHDCAYDEVRKKSGPKRGYVKLLEQRLQQVETLLKSQDAPDISREAPRSDTTTAYIASTVQQSLSTATDFLHAPETGQGADPTSYTPAGAPSQQKSTNGKGGEAGMSWEMIGLGLEEPLPPQDIQDDLYQIYFNKVHPTEPMIHRPRFMAALNLAPQMRPPICLRYSMWTVAAAATDKYEALAEHFYHRARKYAQLDEMKGHGESTITLAHCQTWVLASTYEFKQMYFPRAWLSCGRAVRLAQMMQLHRLDGAGLDVKQCLPPPKDWTEREERRRTFWMAFAKDRYASIGTGWPMTIDERDITTRLPASEDAFEHSKEMATGSLDEVLSPNGAANLQPLGAIVLTAAMFGRNLLHLHRPGPDDNDDDINGGFWNRHREIEQILLQTSLGLPEHLRFPSSLASPNVVFANMSLHTSVICLHQAAIFKADKYRLPTSVSNESKIRCVTAAAEIASIMRMISHMDLCSMSPFMSFSVYVAARVFVQYLKTRPKDKQMTASLQFLLQAMHALRRKNPLTESFLVQLDFDMESAGIQGLQQKAFPQVASNPHAHVSQEKWQCSPVVSGNQTSDMSPMDTFIDLPSQQIPPGRYASSAPAPPFSLHNINSIDMNAQNNSFVQAQMPTDNNHKPPPFGTSNFNFNDLATEMEFTNDQPIDHPSPATISSQSRGSTSQSSYSPGGPQTSIPYRASPKVPPSHLGMLNGTPASAIADSTMFSGFNSSNNDLFNNSFVTSGGMNEAAYQQGFMVGNEWEFTAMNAGNGMTPMADGTWDAMLESVTMGWDGMGPLPEDLNGGPQINSGG